MNVTWSSLSKHASVTVIYSECAHGAFQTLSPDITPVFLRRKKYGNLYCDCKELRDLPEGHKMVWQAYRHGKRITRIVHEVYVTGKEMQLD